MLKIKCFKTALPQDTVKNNIQLENNKQLDSKVKTNIFGLSQRKEKQHVEKERLSPPIETTAQSFQFNQVRHTSNVFQHQVEDSKDNLKSGIRETHSKCII